MNQPEPGKNPGAVTPVVLHQELLLQEASPEQRLAIANLLQDQGLPTSDLNDSVILFGLIYQKRLIGSAGLELYGTDALLRSVSLLDSSKSRGLGRYICQEMESKAKEMGTDTLYLITTTAAAFFGKMGYRRIGREDVPAPVLSSAQFNGVCPASATIMCKIL